jgi:hypothetical protein
MLDRWGRVGKGELGDCSCNLHRAFTSFPQGAEEDITGSRHSICGLDQIPASKESRAALEGSKTREKVFLNVPPVRKTGSQHDTLVAGSFVEPNRVPLI